MSKLFRILIAVIAASSACARDAALDQKKAPAATVQDPRSENDLTTVTLSQEAVGRVGIQTVMAATERVSATRTLGGEVVVPEGRSVVVSAPVAGALIAAGSANAGRRVGRGEAIFRLIPLVPAERDQRIEAERTATSATAEEQAARQRLQRLEQLLKDGAASVRAVEEARAQYEVATAALAASRDRLRVSTRNPIGSQGEIVMAAPFAGVLQTVSAASGQTVAASAPLFQIAQVDTVWIRVPIYAGDADDVHPTLPAAVATLDPSAKPRPARRITAPLKADPAAASVDLYFELSADGATLRPGERVVAYIPLRTTESGLVLPDSAVLYDIHGSTWVYEDLGKGTFARRRITVARHLNDRVVVSRGLAEGTRVVSVGAAELFGTEFGAGK